MARATAFVLLPDASARKRRANEQLEVGGIHRLRRAFDLLARVLLRIADGDERRDGVLELGRAPRRGRVGAAAGERCRLSAQVEQDLVGRLLSDALDLRQPLGVARHDSRDELVAGQALTGTLTEIGTAGIAAREWLLKNAPQRIRGTVVLLESAGWKEADVPALLQSLDEDFLPDVDLAHGNLTYTVVVGTVLGNYEAQKDGA